MLGCFVPPAFSLVIEQAVKPQRATKMPLALVDVRVKGGERALTKSSSAVAQRELKLNREMDPAQADASLCETHFDPGQWRLLVSCPCAPSAAALERYI